MVPVSFLKAPELPAPPPPKPVMLKAPSINNVRRIVRHIAERYGRTLEGVLGERKTADLVYPRSIAFYMLKRLTKRSFPQIGRDLNRDHTTALHAIKKCAIRRMLDTRFDLELNAVESELTGELRPIAFLPNPMSKVCLSSTQNAACVYNR